ncbi:hypothetical protein QFW82_45870 [Streptomyces malaysiensis subsp. malaysiensis]|uniref:hypothetical protein n=1 Tax=Streptomyces malaysiensis TaxID=92644 RepID=UPI0024C06F26|nr:hypothetical protein [Streptomyces sp. NA07423]WHX23861.1 hypothetical protein QFW82_45870 [Streptomyces sp. NA07423]
MAKTIAAFGADSGMGKAVTRRFGQEGYRIALVARRRELLTTPRSARQLVHHVLPEMLERGDGGILFAYGSSVMFPAGGVSGPVPLMAAARNYILTLHEELAGRGVYAGGLAVRALIAQSQASQAVKAGEMKLNMELPVVEPHELADLEWELMRARNQADVLYPRQLNRVLHGEGAEPGPAAPGRARPRPADPPVLAAPPDRLPRLRCDLDQVAAGVVEDGGGDRAHRQRLLGEADAEGL